MNDTHNLSMSEIKELLEIYGYKQQTKDFFIKEFSGFFITIRFLGTVIEFRLKTLNAIPNQDSDLIQISINTTAIHKFDIAKIEVALMTSYQTLLDAL